MRQRATCRGYEDATFVLLVTLMQCHLAEQLADDMRMQQRIAYAALSFDKCVTEQLADEMRLQHNHNFLSHPKVQCQRATCRGYEAATL